jgi:hypothetical protein
MERSGRQERDILARMPDEKPPDDELERAIKRYIAVGASEGATAAARRITQAINVSLGEVTTALQGIGSETPQDVTGTFAVALPRLSLSFSGTSQITAGAAVQGIGRTRGSAVALSGSGTVTVGVTREDAAAAVDQIRSIGEADVERLVAIPPAKWSRSQQICVAVLILIDAYLALPPAVQQGLLEGANLLQGIAAIVTLLSKS